MRTKPGKHRHLDNRGQWTQTSTDPDHDHELDFASLTAADVALLRQGLDCDREAGHR